MLRKAPFYLLASILLLALTATYASARQRIDRGNTETPVFVLDDKSGIDCAAYVDFAGVEPAGYAEQCLGGMKHPVFGVTPLDPTDIGYAQDIGFVSDNFVSFTLNDFPGQTTIATTANVVWGADFDPTGNVLYAIEDNGTSGSPDALGTIDLATGAFASQAIITNPNNDIFTGLAIHPGTGVFYLSDATTLFTVDPGSGVVTPVGNFGTAGAIMIDIDISPGGVMYGHDLGDDSIYTIDMATGAATLVGPTGYNANFAQGMSFDNIDGTLYIFLYIGGGANVYGTVNQATGAVTPLAIDNPLGEFDGATKTGSGGDIALISLSKTVGTTPGVCAPDTSISVPPGTLVTYCYKVTNTGTITLPLHDLVDDQLGVILDDFPLDLAPTDSVDVIVDNVEINTTTTNMATWTAFEVDGPSAEATASATVNVVAPLACNSGAAVFESGLPLGVGWVTANTGNVYWSTTADTDACDNGNISGGSGFAACADSDETNVIGDPYTAELWTNPFDIPAGATLVEMTLNVGFRNLDSGDFFDIDISTDGGATWTTLLSWNEDHEPGEFVTLDLTAYAGMTGVIVRFNYYGDGWDWFVHLDDVALTCEGGGPAILLVDDDDGSPDVRPIYETALTNLGQAYDVWDTNGADDEPTAADMAPYDIVIWFTGDRFDALTGPSGASEAELATWLDSGDVAAGDGTCLFMSSQDYLYARGGNGSDIPTPFMISHLGLASGQSDVAQTAFTGARPIFGTFTWGAPDGLSFTNWSDILEPDGTANVMHIGDMGNANIYKTTGSYATAYWGSAFETMVQAGNQSPERLLERMVDWCYIYSTTGVDVFSK